jgi:hypothetical protein
MKWTPSFLFSHLNITRIFQVLLLLSAMVIFLKEEFLSLSS